MRLLPVAVLFVLATFAIGFAFNVGVDALFGRDLTPAQLRHDVVLAMLWPVAGSLGAALAVK